MKRTILIEFYAGPGAGKSTLAAQVFHLLKSSTNRSVELVQEAAKESAWVKHPIHQPDVFYEQARRVDRLMGVVDVVITDSPLALSGHYGGERWRSIGNAIYRLWHLEHSVWKLFLHRTKAYDPRGRYQTEMEAKLIDDQLRTLCGALTAEGSSEELLKWVRDRLSDPQEQVA